MFELLIFGGTTEGRQLAEYCAEYHIKAVVSVTSEYASDLLPKHSELQIHCQVLDQEQIKDLIVKVQPKFVFDATHPYATMITSHLMVVCKELSVPYFRILRASDSSTDDCEMTRHRWVASATEAVSYLQDKAGNILLTTGSKELELFTEIPDYQQRVYARVLPSKEAMDHCCQLGIKGDHIIGMQGPFSTELNIAMLRQLNICHLVTKESGKAGGYQEKIMAAKACDSEVVIIGRPKQEQGITVKQACSLIYSGNRLKKNRIVLIGMGMGNARQLSVEVLNQLRSSQVIFGAERLLDSIKEVVDTMPLKACYKSNEILNWLEKHPEINIVSVVFSGDIGFYSGASALVKSLQQEPWETRYERKIYPGISSVSYFCAKLGISWEHLYLTSFHGRDGNICELVEQHQNLFLLLGKESGPQQICQRLTQNGFGKMQVAIGEYLSYSEEWIGTGTADQFVDQHFADLSVMVILKQP